MCTRISQKEKFVITNIGSSDYFKQFESQEGRFIQTLHPNKYVKAYIFDEEQRRQINDLMSKGFMPHHTSVGKGLSSEKHWRVENYDGRYGKGYKMITTSVYSKNFNHLTYFLKS